MHRPPHHRGARCRSFYYPFDNQTIVLHLRVPGANVFNCREGIDVLRDMDLTEDNKNVKLLPKTKEWAIDGALAGAVTFRHDDDSYGGKST